MTMRAYTEGCRAMALVAAAAYDAAHHHADAEVRKQNQAFYEFLVPLIKGYCTEMSLDVASLGVQVHGGMGFIEETGAAQYLRDAKILTIYEGTTAIQANDLVGRKTARDGGQIAKAIAAQIEATEQQLAAAQQRPQRRRCTSTWRGAQGLPRRRRLRRRPDQGQPQRRVRRHRALPDARRQPGGRLADGACADGGRRQAGRRRRGAFMQAKIATARFYADHILTKAPGVRDSIVEGDAAVTEMALEAF